MYRARANGSALGVLGRLEITLGEFCATHEFVLIQQLTVQCMD